MITVPMIFVLVGMALPSSAQIPVRCYQTEQAWTEQKALVGLVGHSADASAYYDPRRGVGRNDDGYVALGPSACREVLRGTDLGAFIMAHEFGHRRQDELGLLDAFESEACEVDADWRAMRTVRWWKRQLRRYLGLPPEPLFMPDDGLVVRLSSQ